MSSAKTASRALSPAVPSPSSTCWQKPWVVAIVAASKSASARPMRSRRTASSPGVPALSRASTSSSRAAIPAAASASAVSASSSRTRTRSRSSLVAARVKVTTRSSSSGVPSAT